MNILIVEDNDIDLRLIKRAVGAVDAKIEVRSARDGEEALELLGTSDTKPGIIISDLRMPRMDGFEFLEKIKAHAAYKQIPTIIFSTSTDPLDIRRSYEGHANAYVAKPSDMASFENFADLLKRFWFEAVSLPN